MYHVQYLSNIYLPILLLSRYGQYAMAAANAFGSLSLAANCWKA